MISDVGGGRFYKVVDPQSLPRIFTRETEMVSRSAAVEEYFQPRVVAPADFLRGIDVARSAVPPRLRRDEAQAVAGAGDPRERARRAHPRALARRPRMDAGVDERREEPLGRRVAALAAVGAVLGAARARAHAPEEAAESSTCAPRSIRPRGACMRRSTPSEPTTRSRTASTSSLTVSGPEGSGSAAEPAAQGADAADGARPLRGGLPARPLRVVPAPRVARAARRRRSGHGASTPRKTTVVAESFGHVNNPYPREYLALAPDVATLSSARPSPPAGASIRRRPTLFDPAGEAIRYHEDLWPRFVGAAIALFLLDLFVRRVRLFDRKRTFKDGRTAKRAGAAPA